MRLAGKKALITGGNSGIGLATARLFIAEGAQVAITGRNQGTLRSAESELKNVVAIQADVSVASDRERLFQSIAKEFGTLDIVFANAGIAGATPLGQTTEEHFEEILRVNVAGVFFTVQGALSLMRRGSSVILNGSVVATLGPPGSSAYVASKGAVRAMARTMAGELAPRGIRVNVVSPGGTITPIWSGRTNGDTSRGKLTEVAERFTGPVPLGRLAEVEDIARAVLYFASDESSYVTGVELFVDGGATGTPLGAVALLASEKAAS
jgi:NAD(P)-dependent dehydrogenase (short-subunit alcohol dehydrogenase family)